MLYTPGQKRKGKVRIKSNCFLFYNLKDFFLIDPKFQIGWTEFLPMQMNSHKRRENQNSNFLFHVWILMYGSEILFIESQILVQSLLTLLLVSFYLRVQQSTQLSYPKPLGQLSVPQIKPDWHSEAVSQSPSFSGHGLSTVQ